DPVESQEGILVLSLSGECPADKYETVKKLFLNLTWMMFHLGGVGQGARRPCYSRNSRDRAPWWRGSTLIPKTQDHFWDLPESAGEFQGLFRKRLGNYFAAIQLLLGNAIKPQNPRAAGNVTEENWTEAVDANCRIVVCSGNSHSNKPYALAVLHRLGHQKEGGYNKFLCGVANQKEVIPSPVWIANLGNYQVVTVFGATQDPRCQYLQELEKDAIDDGFRQIWPFRSIWSNVH
ncbi:MAG: hypothetical protein Q6J33_03840, partial [Gloeomargarita sp. DG_2_bins_126]